MNDSPFRQMLSDLHMSQAECARRYGIPYRTVQNWALGVNACPVYLMDMIRKIEWLERPD